MVTTMEGKPRRVTSAPLKAPQIRPTARPMATSPGVPTPNWSAQPMAVEASATKAAQEQSAKVEVQLGDGGAAGEVQGAGRSDGAGGRGESGVGESSGEQGGAVDVEMQQGEGNDRGEQLSEKAQGKRRKSKAASKRGEGCGPGGTQAAIARRRAAGEGN